MTSKQLIETLRNIKQECRNRKACKECIFEKYGEHNNCQIMQLIQILVGGSPCTWKMDTIERIINE